MVSALDARTGGLGSSPGRVIGPLYDPATWYLINYAGTQVTQWDF